MARKLFYRIKEVAYLLDEPVSTVRYWESVFPQVSPSTTPKGVRQYTEREIEILRTIKHLLRDKGLTIEGAQVQLKVKQSPLELRADTLTRLREIRSRLEALRKALT